MRSEYEYARIELEELIASVEEGVGSARLADAARLAIEALRKQEPVNPVNDRCKCGEDVRNWTGDEPFNFCPNCGQAIDWSE